MQRPRISFSLNFLKDLNIKIEKEKIKRWLSTFLGALKKRMVKLIGNCLKTQLHQEDGHIFYYCKNEATRLQQRHRSESANFSTKLVLTQIFLRCCTRCPQCLGKKSASADNYGEHRGKIAIFAKLWKSMSSEQFDSMCCSLH